MIARDPIRIAADAVSPPESRADAEEEALNIMLALHEAGWSICRKERTLIKPTRDPRYQAGTFYDLVIEEWIPETGGE